MAIDILAGRTIVDDMGDRLREQSERVYRQAKESTGRSVSSKYIIGAARMARSLFELDTASVEGPEFYLSKEAREAKIAGFGAAVTRLVGYFVEPAVARLGEAGFSSPWEQPGVESMLKNDLELVA